MSGKDSSFWIPLNVVQLLAVISVFYFGRNVSEYLDILVWPSTTIEALFFVSCLCNILGVLSWQSPRVTSILKSLCALVCALVLFHLLAIIYGAPIVEHVAETFHFSLMLTGTTVLPCCCVLGPSLDAWVRVLVHNSAETAAESSVRLTTLCSIIGAWLGAFPIPLDWDRPWQVWPISCVLGNILGYSFGILISTFYRVCQLYNHRQQKLKFT